MGRVIQTEIKDVIADELLFGALAKGGVVTVDTAGKRKSKKTPVVSESGEFAFSFDAVGTRQ
jgi:ATP-dependent Clp protease ATP-binding subunit ClpA